MNVFILLFIKNLAGIEFQWQPTVTLNNIHFLLSWLLFFSIAVREFALIPQHTSPEVAVKEIDALHDVVLDTRQRLNTNVTMLLNSVLYELVLLTWQTFQFNLYGSEHHNANVQYDLEDLCQFKFRFRTSCFWETSMLAVATFRIQTGPKYASALTKVTPGSSLIVRTQLSHTQTALMTGRKTSQAI